MRLIRGSWLALCAFSLSGCGLVQQTTSAALSPVFTAANNVAANASNDIQLVAGGVSTGASTLGQTASAAYSTVSQTASTVAAVAPAVQATAATSQQMAALGQLQQMSAAQGAQPGKPSDPQLDILPADTLKKLTKDQASLQHLVQSIAFAAPVGEPAAWYTQGRGGTAVVESEDYLGFFLCRTFVQTVTLDGKTTTAHAQACHDPGGGWSLGF